eukprot:8514438-Heterocapsa_arctica.AAC.1
MERRCEARTDPYLEIGDSEVPADERRRGGGSEGGVEERRRGGASEGGEVVGGEDAGDDVSMDDAERNIQRGMKRARDHEAIEDYLE